jgi:hypothetical protein
VTDDASADDCALQEEGSDAGQMSTALRRARPEVVTSRRPENPRVPKTGKRLFAKDTVPIECSQHHAKSRGERPGPGTSSLETGSNVTVVRESPDPHLVRTRSRGSRVREVKGRNRGCAQDTPKNSRLRLKHQTPPRPRCAPLHRAKGLEMECRRSAPFGAVVVAIGAIWHSWRPTQGAAWDRNRRGTGKESSPCTSTDRRSPTPVSASSRRCSGLFKKCGKTPSPE